MNTQQAGSRRHKAGKLGLVLLLLLLPACRIGSGFDTAEKRRNLNWDDTPVQAASAATPEQQAIARLDAPIVYLLVAG